MMRHRPTLALLLLVLGTSYLSAANIAVPGFLLLTRAYNDGNGYRLGTYADLELRIEGGLKFGGDLQLSFENEDLEGVAALPDLEGDAPTAEWAQTVANALDRSLRFEGASIEIREVFGLPLTLTYFTGLFANIGSGTEFPRRFGTLPFATDYRGYLYFPSGVRYDAMQEIRGTGIQIATGDLFSWGEIDLVGYQDGNLGTGTYSLDLVTLINAGIVRGEAFFGISGPTTAGLLLHGGLMVYVGSDTGSRFLSQIGIPRWNPGGGDPLDISNFYFLFEPRVSFDPLNLYLTFFWRPAYYNQQPTDEGGNIDLNLKLLVGDTAVDPISGGLETTLLFTPVATDSTEQIRFSAGPFLSIASDGVVWQLKVKAALLPFDASRLFEGFIGIRTEF